MTIHLASPILSMQNTTKVTFQSLPAELRVSIWESLFHRSPEQQQKRTLNVTGYGTERTSLQHYKCKNAHTHAIDEPLVNSSGKNIRLICFEANEAFRQVLRQRTRNFNPSYIVYSYRLVQGRIHGFWLPVDPEQDMFFFHPDFMRDQVSTLKEMHAGNLPKQWEAMSYRAGLSGPRSPAHIMFDNRWLLRIADESLPTPPTYATLGSAPDFLVALNCCIPAIAQDLSLGAWMTMFAALRIKPEKITVLIFKRLSDSDGYFSYADLKKISCPPSSIEEIRRLDLTQVFRIEPALFMWARIVNDAAIKGLQFPVLELAYTLQ